MSVRKQYLDRRQASRWYRIQGDDPYDITYVLRVDVDRAQPFVLGSILGTTKVTYDEDIKQSTKRSVAQIASNAEKGRHNIRIPVADPQSRVLTPLWLTNGTFFADDCWRQINGKDVRIKESWLQGPIVDRSVRVHQTGSRLLLINPPAVSLGGPENKGKPIIQEYQLNRGIFLQRLGPDGRVTLNIQQSGHGARYWANQGYYSAIGGGGILVQDGNFRDSEWNQKRQNGGFDPGGNQSYCAGPIIALNSTGRILYLILNRTHGRTREYTDSKGKRHHVDYANFGKDWTSMSSYLKSGLARDIGRNDGGIKDAIVFDGGGSRGLWIRSSGQGSRKKFGLMEGYFPQEGGPGTFDEGLNYRPIPHHICLWTRP